MPKARLPLVPIAPLVSHKDDETPHLDKILRGYLDGNRRSLIDELATIEATILALQLATGTVAPGVNPNMPIQFCRVTNSAAIPTTSGVVTTLTYDTVVSNNGGTAMFDPATPDRIKAPSAGVYLAFASSSFGVNAAGSSRRMAINYQPSNFIIADVNYAPPAAAPSIGIVATIFVLALGDYIQGLVLQDSGGVLNVLADQRKTPILALALLGTF